MKRLYPVNPQFCSDGVVEVAAEVSGKVALEASADTAVGLAFCPTSMCLGLVSGWWTIRTMMMTFRA